MEATTVSALTELLVNILLGCFSLMCLTMVVNFVQSIINDHKLKKREVEREARELEYHNKRMNELK
jgi:hypothetical protein